MTKITCLTASSINCITFSRFDSWTSKGGHWAAAIFTVVSFRRSCSFVVTLGALRRNSKPFTDHDHLPIKLGVVCTESWKLDVALFKRNTLKCFAAIFFRAFFLHSCAIKHSLEPILLTSHFIRRTKTSLFFFKP